ncbi:diadenosine tetraphosphate (Ap4A) HIT family hydrolase [Rhizobium sp. PP-F2F-G48]|uniref:HIT family protein n=1 Tax=Rhizobium sp. PP-F2F-G48 TaxID=2135651 RepID=UPI0010D84FE2|nr:HIT family protein [Rhizobium sp. PP-F2F-G48]TCM54203.1 diadenosine tetraphosphate (Ap4A) HIT family hydrolase [Rhizobium sp. PP-F2F-G48]
MTPFELDPRLARDSDLVARLDLCQLRLSRDARWPWLILIPERNAISETFELSSDEQATLSRETNRVAEALKRVTGATKINIGALGNIVRQLHVHVVARTEGDANWPGPIWGFGTAEAWDTAKRDDFLNRLTESLT